jgi:hypothetical protein
MFRESGLGVGGSEVSEDILKDGEMIRMIIQNADSFRVEGTRGDSHDE